MAEVKATYTKDIHYSGIITVDGETVISMDANMDAKHPDVPIINRYINNGRKYRANKSTIDDIVDKFENDIWTEYDNNAAEKTSGSDQNTEKNNNQGEE